jgi:hypothetical protein
MVSINGSYKISTADKRLKAWEGKFLLIASEKNTGYFS